MRALFCRMCREPIPVEDGGDSLERAEKLYGTKPDPNNDDWVCICDGCANTLALCAGCEHRWVSREGPCPACGSPDVRRGEAAFELDKARGNMPPGLDFGKAT